LTVNTLVRAPVPPELGISPTAPMLREGSTLRAHFGQSMTRMGVPEMNAAMFSTASS